MAQPARQVRHAYAEYLAFEAESEVRHEYVDGEMYAMSGGKPVHARLAVTFGRVVEAALLGGRCATYSSDLRIYIHAEGRSAYPDLSIVCGPVEHHPADPDAAVNPSVIVEILSDTTETYDRGEKFAAYRLLPSLRDYVLVRADARIIEHFQRTDDGAWLMREAGAGEWVELSIGARFALDEVYAGVDLLPPRRRKGFVAPVS